MPMSEQNNATAREIVGKAYPDAYCAISGGLFQIRRPLDNASPARLACLSSQHVTAEEAWYFAATRVLSDEAARLGSESNKEVVLATFPSAYCAVVRCGYFQIQRPRTRSDRGSVLKYMPLSGRFSAEYFAWQDAAQSLVDSAPRTSQNRDQDTNANSDSTKSSFNQLPFHATPWNVASNRISGAEFSD
jgi:hypothetical protein